jgi:hypothetical protein
MKKYHQLKACLASIIVVALITLLIEVRQCYLIFKRSKFEAVFIIYLYNIFYLYLKIFTF